MAGVTVLGGGNTAFAVAANLSLQGHSVHLCELPGFAGMVDPIASNRRIRLDGVAETGEAQLAWVGTDFEVALQANQLVLLIVPAYAHRAFALACAPFLRPGQVVVLMPGTLGSLEFGRLLREAGCCPGAREVVIAETDTAPYVCRKQTPTSAHIWGVVSGLGLAAVPSAETSRVAALLGPLFTQDGRARTESAIRTHENVLACGLSAMNPVVHPAGVLMNAGRVEYARGDFYFYEEGVTPAVCSVIEALDAERLALGRAFGCVLTPVAEAFHAAGFGPAGNLWSTVNGSRMLTQLRAPGAVSTRWLTEDVPYGIGCWADLALAVGVPTPVMDGLVVLGRIAAGIPASAGRGARELGLEGLLAPQMVAHAVQGWAAARG